MTQQFHIPGRPVPKGRPRLGKGRVYTPKKTKDYQKLVAGCATIAGLDLITGRVGMSLVICMAGGRRGDVDNIAKSIMDALNGIAYTDDKYVDQLNIERQWIDNKSDQGVHVSVWSLDD